MKLIVRLAVIAVVAQGQSNKRGLARHSVLSTVELQTSVAVVPPANVATTEHQKSKGGGYLPGSPLYGPDPSAVATPVAEDEALPPIAAAGIFLPFFSLLLGIFCLVLVSLFNRGKGPVSDHESVMRTVFEKCDLGGNNTANKYELVRSIRAYQADNAGFLDLDKALQRIDASIDLDISWNSFRALGVPNQTFVGGSFPSRERVMTVPATMTPTALQPRPVPSSPLYARDRAQTTPSSSHNAPLSVQVAPPGQQAPPSVQVQPGQSTSFPQAPPTGGNWGAPLSVQIQPGRSAPPGSGNWPAFRGSV